MSILIPKVWSGTGDVAFLTRSQVAPMCSWAEQALGNEL